MQWKPSYPTYEENNKSITHRQSQKSNIRAAANVMTRLLRYSNEVEVYSFPNLLSIYSILCC